MSERLAKPDPMPFRSGAGTHGNRTALHEVVPRREAPSQRKHYRLTTPAQVDVAGVRYTTTDWGLGGFSLHRFQGTAVVGQRLDVVFRLDFQGFEIAFAAQAEVLRHEGTRLAVRFPKLREREAELLKYFGSQIVAGQMASVDGILKRMDRPLTLVPASPARGAARAKGRERSRRLAVSALYLAIGIPVCGHLALALLRHFWRLRVESAVISTSLDEIVAQHLGRVAAVHVEPGRTVKAGEALLRLESAQVADTVATARQALEASGIAQRGAETKKQEELKKLLAYRSISDSQLEASRARVAAIAAERRVAQIQLDRLTVLFKQGLTSASKRDESVATLAKFDGALQEARAALRIAERSSETTRTGYFFSGNFLVGDLQQFTADESAARQRMELAQAALQQALARESELVYRAPYDGVVAQVFKSAGVSVDRGDRLAVVRRLDGDLYVDAYLTQDEAGWLLQGARGKAYVPARGRHFGVEVLSIDRTAGFLRETREPGQARSQFGWRDLGDRSAYAKLGLVGVSAADRRSLTAGLPAFVELPKRRFAWLFGDLPAAGIDPRAPESAKTEQQTAAKQ